MVEVTVTRSNFWLKFVVIVISWSVLIISLLPKQIFQVYHQIEEISLSSPWISARNSSSVVNKRFEAIRKDFTLSMAKNKWSILRKSTNISIETTGDWPIYIRTTAIFTQPPKVLFKLFTWENFDKTQRRIDPFYESIQLISSPSKTMKIAKKTTKRPLIFPKRIFTVAMLEAVQNNDVKIQSPISFSSSRNFTIPKGSIIISLVTITLGNDLIANCKDCTAAKGEYVTAFQDFIAWFIPTETGGTLLEIVMKVDLGPDVPRWAFLGTVAATGIWSMERLRELASMSGE